MAEITHPIIVKFLNEQARPHAETALRDFIQNEEFLADYTQSIEPLLEGLADDDLIQDGREGEGVTRVTVGQLRAFITVLRALDTGLDGSRPVVRHLTVRNVMVQ
jgi:hypothetical protein